MTFELIDIILEGARNKAKDRNSFNDFLKKNLGGMYDSFIEEAKDKMKDEVYNSLSSFDYLVSTTLFDTYVCGVIMNKLDLFNDVTWNMNEVLDNITEDATNCFVDKFALNGQEKEVFYQWLGNAGDYMNEYAIIDCLAFKNTKLTSDLLRMYKECFGKDYDEEVEELAEIKKLFISNYFQSGDEVLSAKITTPMGNLVYNIINTSTYGTMGVIVVSCTSPMALTEYGFDEKECETFGKMGVGETRVSEEYGNGVVVVRMG